MPQRQDFDQNVSAYAIGRYQEPRIILLFSSAKPLDLQEVKTVYVYLKHQPSLDFCVDNLKQVNRIMLLPRNSDPRRDPNCAGLSDDQLGRMAFDFFQDSSSGPRPLCPHS
jgi:hypothetical protein